MNRRLIEGIARSRWRTAATQCRWRPTRCRRSSSPAQAFGRVWLAGRAITTIEHAEVIFADAAWNAVRRRDAGEA
jgi:hypothetical protein